MKEEQIMNVCCKDDSFIVINVVDVHTTKCEDLPDFKNEGSEYNCAVNCSGWGWIGDDKKWLYLQ